MNYDWVESRAIFSKTRESTIRRCGMPSRVLSCARVCTRSCCTSVPKRISYHVGQLSICKKAEFGNELNANEDGRFTLTDASKSTQHHEPALQRT